VAEGLARRSPATDGGNTEVVLNPAEAAMRLEDERERLDPCSRFSSKGFFYLGLQLRGEK